MVNMMMVLRKEFISYKKQSEENNRKDDETADSSTKDGDAAILRSYFLSCRCGIIFDKFTFDILSFLSIAFHCSYGLCWTRIP